MRWYRRSIGPLTFVTGLLLAISAGAQEPAKKATARPQAKVPQALGNDPARLARLLQMWERRSTQLQTLDLKLTRIDRSKLFDDPEEFEGRVMLQSPNLAWIDFSKVAKEDGKRVVTPDERIICTGDEVWQYKVDTRQVFIYPLDTKTRNRALEEGPLPFLFNMKAEDAKKRYTMSLPREDENSYQIIIVPKLEIDQNAFSQAHVLLSKKSFFPTRIVLISPDGKSMKDFEIPLATVKANQPIAAENFKGKIPPKWKVVRNPAGEPEGNNPQAGAAVRQPALPRAGLTRPRR